MNVLLVMKRLYNQKQTAHLCWMRRFYLLFLLVSRPSLAYPFEDGIHILIVQPFVTILGIIAVSCFELLEEAHHADNAKFARQGFHASDADLFERHRLCVHQIISSTQVRGFSTCIFNRFDILFASFNSRLENGQFRHMP